jgi:DNA-binding beta-propeller fold protein YncE
MNRKRNVALAAMAVALAVVWTAKDDVVIGQAPKPGQVPIFEYDPTFPKPMNETWAIGPIGGIAVDRQDHVFVVHRPEIIAPQDRFGGADDTPPKAACCVPAPAVLELDPTGRLVRSWGGPGPGYDWPQTEHGVWVDGKDNVWLGGNGAKDAHLLKFTHDGKFVAQFGKPGMNKGNEDTMNLGMPANITVDDVANEIYIADGYGNRRVVVLDTITLGFKRMWGAYGNKPAPNNAAFNPDAPPDQQFRLPHNISISKDGFVYVADRPNNRIQVFRKDGTFVKETFIQKRTFLNGAVSGFALSPDPEQRFLYMIDGADHHVFIIERQSLQVVARFGQQGLWGGYLNVPHAIAVDSKGNIYVGENFDARRFQRFLYKGLGTPVAGTIPPTTIVR